MAVREIRAAAQLIGRRNALRYLAIGVGASLVAACSGKGEEAPVAGPASAPGSSAAVSAAPGSTAPASSAAAAPAPASSGPVARAFDAFIGGTWKLESTTPGDKTVHGTATVTAPPGGNGGFTIVWDTGGEPVTWTGSWLLRGGHLRTEVFGSGKELARLSGSEALTVPATVTDSVSLTLPWKPPGAKDAGDGQQLKVSYKNDVLRIVHTERGGSESVHVCTRAT
ncbi:hypothetical protein OG365_15015 [Streptomyces sp. NBC_00853]|uniref:hypothetical protein n=1 Tax=unclassified Streptomyces TaxID=2593676 RepID=UPI00369EC2A0|nr:hypothetical protein OG365_15015 [Streptomyces sp. NBC_00853]